MATRYKLWLQIEAQPDNGDDCFDVGEPHEMGTFRSLRAAEKAMGELHRANWMDGHDPRCICGDCNTVRLADSTPARPPQRDKLGIWRDGQPR